MDPTQFCWRCGLPVAKDLLFCPKPKKCEETYYRQQDRRVRKGKKAGYGVAGNMR